MPDPDLVLEHQDSDERSGLEPASTCSMAWNQQSNTVSPLEQFHRQKLTSTLQRKLEPRLSLSQA